MQRKKMSLNELQSKKLSRSEMKNIMGGYIEPKGCKGILVCNPNGPTGCSAEGADCECKKSGDSYTCQ